MCTKKQNAARSILLIAPLWTGSCVVGVAVHAMLSWLWRGGQTAIDVRCRSWRFNGLVTRFKVRRTLLWVGGTGGNCTCTLGLGAGAGLASLHALSLGALFCRCRKKNAHCRVRSTNFAPVSRKHQRHTWRGARTWRLPNSCEQSCEGVFGREVETLTLFNFTTLFFGFVFCFQLPT